MPLLTIGSVLDAASKRATLELEPTYAARNVIRSALDGYVAALEAGAAACLAEKLGVPCGERPTVEGATAALLRALEQLPELVAVVSAALPAGTVPQVVEPDSEADALWAETRALGDMKEIVDDHFRCVAEELAGRARLIQLRLSDRGREAPESRVIRRLTWLASERGLRDVHGLKRRDAGNWSEQVKVAQRERRRFECLRSPPPARARLPETCADGAEEPSLVLKRLALLERPVVIVGGEVDPQKLERLRRRSGLVLEWVGIDDVAPLERRIRHGTVGALVILEALVSHSEIDPVMRGAREAGVPLAYGGKAGLASIEAALCQLDAGVTRAVA